MNNFSVYFIVKAKLLTEFEIIRLMSKLQNSNNQYIIVLFIKLTDLNYNNNDDQ